MNTIALTLPWPPSVNVYWRANGHRRFISQRGVDFCQGVWAAVLEAGQPRMEGRLAVWVTLCPPTRRAFDVDNFSKAILDSLVKARVFEDDGQVDWIACERGPLTEGGQARVFIAPAEAARQWGPKAA